jgi:hypothetical protein
MTISPSHPRITSPRARLAGHLERALDGRGADALAAAVVLGILAVEAVALYLLLSLGWSGLPVVA